MSTDTPPPTYAELMAAFRAMDAAGDRLVAGTGSGREYRAAWDRYETAARAYLAAHPTATS